MIWSFRIYANRSVAAKIGRFGGVEAYDVLVTNITRNLACDCIHILQGVRKVSNSTCLLR